MLQDRERSQLYEAMYEAGETHQLYEAFQLDKAISRRRSQIYELTALGEIIFLLGVCSHQVSFVSLSLFSSRVIRPEEAPSCG